VHRSITRRNSSARRSFWLYTPRMTKVPVSEHISPIRLAPGCRSVAPSMYTNVMSLPISAKRDVFARCQ